MNKYSGCHSSAWQQQSNQKIKYASTQMHKYATVCRSMQINLHGLCPVSSIEVLRNNWWKCKPKLCFQQHTTLYKFAVDAQQQHAFDALSREIYEHIHLTRGTRCVASVGLGRYPSAKLGDNFVQQANIFRRPSLSTFVHGVDIWDEERALTACQPWRGQVNCVTSTIYIALLM